MVRLLVRRQPTAIPQPSTKPGFSVSSNVSSSRGRSLAYRNVVDTIVPVLFSDSPPFAMPLRFARPWACRSHAPLTSERRGGCLGLGSARHRPSRASPITGVVPSSVGLPDRQQPPQRSRQQHSAWRSLCQPPSDLTLRLADLRGLGANRRVVGPLSPSLLLRSRHGLLADKVYEVGWAGAVGSPESWRHYLRLWHSQQGTCPVAFQTVS